METELSSLFLFPLSISFIDFASIFLLLILLVLSALLSGSEVAYFSLKKKDIIKARDKKTHRIESIEKLLRNKQKLLSTILIGNNFVNICIVLLSTYISTTFIHPYLEDFSILGWNLVLLFDIVVITFLLLLFGEIIPKIYAGLNQLSFAQLTAPLLQFVGMLTRPIGAPLLWFSNLLEGKIKPGSTISVDQLSQALEITQEDEMTTNEEQKILEGIVNFGNTETREIMTPRVDVFSLSLDDTYPEVLKKISSKGFSRVPVYDKSIDEISGVLYAKDLLPYLNEVDLNWNSLLRKAFFVPENKKLDDLLADFQERKIHMAIVVDEYGGTSGLVTLEDVMEEIVGDISDEFDDEDIYFSKLDNDNFILEGKTGLKDFFRIMEVEEEDLFEEHKGEAESLAGFVLEINGETPNRRQKINFYNYSFTIESIDKKRIKRIKVSRMPTTHNESND
ncbi:Magnesium/cobalt efflux protein CorC [Candidatus Ornithobacterium hominis]|uniref:gliding motility-associated protein GldE n=1 Tax=Candidatus Ornithobacterium hominis TaxID=2497989 RepID=UPI0024BCFF41|nr:gliding motility-associated protein GldE [Candidatus Ornithobacterium hominis]CAI9429016.1 Magnesium/cobalt efflux protein CorC [Candidatus Ornithobacterium hominis]